MNNDIWILGSSIIKRASQHTKQRPTGQHLGLDKKGYNVLWIGQPGMKWEVVEHLTNTMINCRGFPSVLLIHCGGNDIVENTNVELLCKIRHTISYLRFMMPYTLLIWSFILPRLEWRNEESHAKIDKARRRINRGVRSFIVKLGGKVIQHLDFDDHHKSLFHEDKVHLSFIGSDIFINSIQSGLELFLTHPWRTVYPEELH